MVADAETILLRAAVAGDALAFSQLFEPHRRELLFYGYRLLGSLQDAEDLVQEVSVRAWLKLATFEQRASFRTWLYRITTNLGCDLIETRQRRSLPQYTGPQANQTDVASLTNFANLAAISTASPDSPWISPLPSTLLVDGAGEPETHYLRRESVTLAFLVVLQVLPARQRAIFLLRDVLEFRAQEVAELLSTSTAAVESALQRARATLAQHYTAQTAEHSSTTALDASTRTLLDKYIAAWEAANIQELVALLHDEATLAMPPYPWWLQGRAAIASFFAALLAESRPETWRLVAVEANAQPAYLSYRHMPDGSYQAQSISLMTVSGPYITQLTSFLDPAICQHFASLSGLTAPDSR